jgi:hypothetical protein
LQPITVEPPRGRAALACVWRLLFLFGLLFVLASTGAAPFVYTLF